MCGFQVAVKGETAEKRWKSRSEVILSVRFALRQHIMERRQYKQGLGLHAWTR